MKITDVRTMLLRGPDPHGVGGVERTWHVLLVRVDTDAGVYGLGETGNFMGDRQAIAYAREWLIGRDPLAVRPFVRAMLSGGLPPYEPQMSPTATLDGPAVWAVSGLEMAISRSRGQGPRDTGLQPARWRVPRPDPGVSRSQRGRRSERPRCLAGPGRTGARRRLPRLQVRRRVDRPGGEPRSVEPPDAL